MGYQKYINRTVRCAPYYPWLHHHNIISLNGCVVGLTSCKRSIANIQLKTPSNSSTSFAPTRFRASAHMCSFDVVSLFTNVPLEETINICLDVLYRNDEVDTPMVIGDGVPGTDVARDDWCGFPSVTLCTGRLMG